jgi:hypothetical protein
VSIICSNHISRECFFILWVQILTFCQLRQCFLLVQPLTFVNQVSISCRSQLSPFSSCVSVSRLFQSPLL